MLDQHEALKKLRYALIGLYEDVADIKRVLADAGIITLQIDFRGSSNTVWYNVLNETIKQNRLKELINVIQREWEVNDSITVRYNEYLQSQQQLQKVATNQTEAVNKKIDGLSITQGLWLLPSKKKVEKTADANYDFPVSEDTLLGLSEAKNYRNVTAQSQPMSPEDFCTEEYLLKESHQIITGRRLSGKTWLRLYFEQYVLITNVAPPPIFFFATARIHYRLNELQIVNCLAHSLAPQLFFRFFMQINANQEEIDSLLAHWGGVAPFIKQYGKSDEVGDIPLAQPTPPVSMPMIENAYRENRIYSQMKQWVEGAASIPFASTVEQILDDIKKVTELLGHHRLFVLIDNWDKIAEPARNSLLAQILSPSLLDQFSNRNIFLKVFVPTIDQKSLQHFQESCKIERHTDSGLFHLSLFSYP